ncbi:10518_t:CDS:2 [Paraglomus brasilianum]|uniref:10518_t:CDS:1 n=1 Tax=Paraglomus brasilianum TaxID=144538 RepID=A0A9N8YTX4_9GLOM|nr:10518_t:CDS:2 [Paraglomus brasilianum]
MSKANNTDFDSREKGLKKKKNQKRVSRTWFVIAIVINVLMILASAYILYSWHEFGVVNTSYKNYILTHAAADVFVRAVLILLALQRHGSGFAVKNTLGFLVGREDYYLLSHYNKRKRRMIRDALRLKAMLVWFAVFGMIGWVYAIRAAMNKHNSILMYASYGGAVIVGFYLMLNTFVFNCYQSMRYTVRINGKVVKKGGGRIHLKVVDDDSDSDSDDDSDGSDEDNNEDGDDNGSDGSDDDDGDDGDDSDDGGDDGGDGGD